MFVPAFHYPIQYQVGFLDQDFRNKSVAAQIPHDAGLAPTLYTGGKFLFRQESNHHAKGIFNYKVLRRIFGRNRKENESWSRLYNKGLHSLYSLLNFQDD